MSSIGWTEDSPQYIFGGRILGVRVGRVLERLELLPTPLERLPRLLDRLAAYFGPSLRRRARQSLVDKTASKLFQIHQL
jgi:hypothetical protein